MRRTDRFVHLAIAASDFAIRDAGLEIDEGNADRVGVMIGSGIGGLPLIERMHKVVLEKGPGRITPFFIPGLIVNLAAGQVSIRLGARGPNGAPSTACTTGLHAVGDAFRLIQVGFADAMIAGGSEGVISPLAVGGFAAMKALSTRNDEPERASRPWDRDRDGFVMSEGSGLLVLEELESAVARGASILAELVGYGMSGDAYHVSAPHPEGRGSHPRDAQCPRDAGLEPEVIDYINAHGTSTPLGDLGEVRAIKTVFGDHAYRLAVSSTNPPPVTFWALRAAWKVDCSLLPFGSKSSLRP